MSPHERAAHVGNFVQDLVEMAKATEQLPQVQADLADAHITINNQLATIQRLELKLMERANEINGLHSKLTAAEVARDNAETMFLECDDKLSAFRRLVKGFATDVGDLVSAQEPTPEVKAEPQPPTHEPPMGQSATDPTANSPSGSQSQNASSLDVETRADALPQTSGSGVISGDPGNIDSQVGGLPSSETGVSVPSGGSASFHHTSEVPSATTTAPSSENANGNQPYFGKRYVDVPGWVSPEDWHAGGGTEADYHWRP